MKALVVTLVLAAASAAHAAPWSFELPAGYTEEPGAADADAAALRAHPSTVSIDAQAYMSADHQVGLIRMTWLSKTDEPLRHQLLVDQDREARLGGDDPTRKHISDDQRWVGEQLVSNTIDEIRGTRVHQRRMYSVDTSGVVYLFAITCMGQSDQLAACEHAQQTMQLTLPNEATLPNQILPKAAPRPKRGMLQIIGSLAFLALMIGLAIWIYESARRGGRRRRRR